MHLGCGVRSFRLRNPPFLSRWTARSSACSPCSFVIVDTPTQGFALGQTFIRASVYAGPRVLPQVTPAMFSSIAYYRELMATRRTL
jgi:hypothetical protein